MKSLYTYLLSEARGLLREEYDYTNMVDFITDLVMSDYERFANIKEEHIIVEDKDLMAVYPIWIGGAQIILNNHEGNDAGSFIPAEASLDNNKLYFDIYINVESLIKQSKMVGEKFSSVALKNLCISALQHEFKHAFDEWIKRIKNLTGTTEDLLYFINKKLLAKSKLPKQWKEFFTSTHYLYSKYEKTAHQQELIHLYRNTAIGQLFIKILKIKYQTPQKMLDYIFNMSISQYTSFYFNIAEEMSEILKGTMAENDLVPIIQTPYIDHLWMVKDRIEELSRISEEECDLIYDEIKDLNFQNIKLPKQGSSRDNLLGFLQNIKNQNIKYLNSIYKRTF